jgi:hypothetical protein
MEEIRRQEAGGTEWMHTSPSQRVAKTRVQESRQQQLGPQTKNLRVTSQAPAYAHLIEWSFWLQDFGGHQSQNPTKPGFTGDTGISIWLVKSLVWMQCPLACTCNDLKWVWHWDIACIPVYFKELEWSLRVLFWKMRKTPLFAEMCRQHFKP